MSDVHFEIEDGMIVGSVAQKSSLVAILALHFSRG